MKYAKKEQAIRMAAEIVGWCGSYAEAGRVYDLAPAHFWNAVKKGYVSPKLCKALDLNRKYPPTLKIRRDDMSKAAASIRDNLEPGQVADLKAQL